MGPIVVREATAGDAERLADCNRRMARETEGRELDPARALRGVRAVLEVPTRGAYFVAEAGGEALGTCLVTREWSDWRDGEFWWLQSVFVLPELRGRGVFRALYDVVLARARASTRVCGLRLYVEQENARAQAVYAAVGMHASHYRFFEIDFVLGEAEPGDAGGAGGTRRPR